MTTLHIKNMVCDRCKKVIRDEVESLGVEVIDLELGKLVINADQVDIQKIGDIIRRNGFELIEDEEIALIEKIKLFLLSMINSLPMQRKEKLSVLLSKEMNKDYSSLSKLFSRNEHITLEKFFLKLKLEKAKELIQENKYSFSEIADLLDYANSNHLAKQFKEATGMSMTEYKKSSYWGRKPLDKII
ncbi:MAG: helix-turn-helix domain-containing protein [Fulvivirga sp.]